MNIARFRVEGGRSVAQAHRPGRGDAEHDVRIRYAPLGPGAVTIAADVDRHALLEFAPWSISPSGGEGGDLDVVGCRDERGARGRPRDATNDGPRAVSARAASARAAVADAEATRGDRDSARASGRIGVEF